MQENRLSALVLKAQQGDRDAFDELMRAFEGMVFGIVLRRLRNRSEARELTQDVFMQALRKLPQLRETERFSGWLKQIAVRMAINRAVRGPHETLCSPEIFGSVGTEPQSPLDSLLEDERADQLRDGLSRLRELDRKTLIAFYFEGRSLKQMSDEFASPVGTIKRRLHMARNRLREELTELQPA